MKVLLLLGDFLTASLVIALCNWLSLIPFRRARNEHWTERARKLFPARLAALSGIWLVPIDLVLAQRLLWPEETPHWFLSGFAGWLGAMSGTYFFDREVFPWLAPRDWLREAITGWALRFAWLFLFFGIMAAMPSEVSWRTWLLGAILIGAFAAGSLGGLIWCCKKIRLLQAPPERLSQIVADVSARMNVPVHGVWMLRSSVAQALALTYTGDLLFTRRLLDICSGNELAAICAHELGHLCESKFARAGRLLSGFVYLPWAFVRPLRHAVGDWAFLILFALSWVSLILTRKLSRRLETRADNMAREQECDPGVYACALSKLYEANLMPAVMPKRNSKTHPDLYDRLLAVGVQPDYPRPEPASRLSVAHLYSVILGVLLVPALRTHFAGNQHDVSPEPQSAMSQEDSKPMDTPASDTREQ
jgi:Zn-dependent protease with chaperone function